MDMWRSRPRAAPRLGARIGVIDVGSNSVRLVVFSGSERSPAIFFNEKVLCGLGTDLNETGKLSDEGKAMALDALTRFGALTRTMRLDAVDAVGTAAIREAEDGAAFVDEVARRAGIEIRVASGQDEARLAAQGLLFGEPWADGVVADMGGASMELVEVRGGQVADGLTAALGPLRLGEGSAAALDRRIDERMDASLGSAYGQGSARGRTLYILGGSWRALVKAHLAHTNNPLPVLHGFGLSAADALTMADWAAELSPKAFSEISGSSERRSAVAPRAARVLAHLIRRLTPETVSLSAYGLREGVLWEYLSADVRQEDPLIHAARGIEAQQGRMPGFGDELWRWLTPLFPSASSDERRLAHAACLLADASWQADSAFRSQACFDLISRNNFGGVDPAGRVFIGIILLYRYRGGDKALKAQPARKLVPSAARGRAEAFGRAVRLGAMLSGAAPGVLPSCPIAWEGGALALRLTGPHRQLDGEEVRNRLSELAKAIGAEAVRIDRLD